MKNSFLTAGSLLALALCAASPAFAHAKLVRSTPSAGTTVMAPKSIRLTFSEKLSPAFSGLDVGMGGGMQVPVKSAISVDGKTIIGTPQGPLMSGTYKLKWHAVATDDGHRTDGTLAFKVK